MSLIYMKSNKKLAENQPWYNIPVLDQFGNKKMIAPTRLSIEAGQLEWPIPGGDAALLFCAEYYPEFTLSEKPTILPKVAKAPVVKETTESEDESEAEAEDENYEEIEPEETPEAKPEASTEPRKLSPTQVGELKSQLREELKGRGIKFPKNSSLSDLQALIALADDQ